MLGKSALQPTEGDVLRRLGRFRLEALLLTTACSFVAGTAVIVPYHELALIPLFDPAQEAAYHGWVRLGVPLAYSVAIATIWATLRRVSAAPGGHAVLGAPWRVGAASFACWCLTDVASVVWMAWRAPLGTPGLWAHFILGPLLCGAYGAALAIPVVEALLRKRVFPVLFPDGEYPASVKWPLKVRARQWIVYVAGGFLPMMVLLAAATLRLRSAGMVALLSLGYTSFALLVIGGLLAAAAARSLTAPIANLADAAKHVTTGDLDVRVPVTSADELGELSRAFNSMLEALREHRAVREQMVAQEREQERRLAQQERLATVGQLAGGIAHDFNNLLSVIVSYSAIASEELPEGHSAREDLAEIRKAAQRAAALTRQLLAFSRRELAQPRPLDLGAVAADLDKLLLRLLGEDIELVTRAEEGLATVVMDPSQVEQVLINLAVNARDAMPNGGRLSITLANAQDPDRGPVVRLVVTDDGCGMPKEVQARIFEPFFTTKGQGKGTGLGLSTVHGIVHQAGGRIRVESAPGRGTTFTIDLPSVDALASAIHRSAPPVPEPARSERVLVCEDEAPLRAAMDRILRQAGYRVTLACDGSEALEQLEKEAYGYDLVLSDVVMPNLSGGALAERIHERRPQLPVLFVSGHTADDVVRKGVEAGTVPFLPKPFTAEALLTKVAELLTRARVAV